MTELILEESHGQLQLQPNNNHNSTINTGPPTNLMVGNLPNQPNHPTPLRIGGETTHNSHSRPPILSSTSNGELESGAASIWTKSLNGHIVTGDPLSPPGGAEHGISS
ncbi:hypothetical protein FXO38_15168 [Capsicum annuum]|nr:hypothetical protein FXO38_15168 [Capsicum annuum]